MTRTIVVLEVLDDHENRDWWEAIGLPEPWRWNLEPLDPMRKLPNGTHLTELASRKVAP